MRDLIGIRKRSLASAGAVALLAVSVAVAEAAVRPGTYRGKTDKGSPVAFKITKKGKQGRRISHFRFSKVRLKCSDGSGALNDRQISSGPKKIRVGRRGGFGLVVEYPNGGRWTADGRVKGKRARGVLRLRGRFTADGEQHPRGSIRCDSGKRKFKARIR